MIDIPRHWLQRKGTPEEFELAELQQKATAFGIPLDKILQKLGSKPFGLLTERWRDFIDKLEPDDELWSFSSPDSTFAKKCGSRGYVIIREGVFRDMFITLMS